MFKSNPRIIKHLPRAIVLLFVALLFACGSSATATSVPAAAATTAAPTAVPATTAPSTGGGPAPTAVPTAMPEATQAPAMVAPAGTINIGQRETGIFQGHPSQASSPRIQFLSSSIGEGLVTIREDLLPNPMIASSSEISSDSLTWTWNIQPGVQFHKGYGELTTEDVVYSYEQWYEGALLARAGFIGQYFGFDGNEKLNATTTIIDDLTFEVFT